MANKYKVEILEQFEVYHVVEVEADCREQAKEEALEKIQFCDYELQDFEYNSSHILETREIEDGHKEDS